MMSVITLAVTVVLALGALCESREHTEDRPA